MTISVSPSTPVVGDTVTISATVPGEGGVAVDCAAAELTIVSVPAASALATGLVLDDAGDPSLEFDPDVAGEYGISVQRFVETFAPPGYDGAAEPYTVALNTETLTVYVGSTATLPIVTPVGSLTISLTLGDGDLVLAAALVAPTTNKSYLASLDSTVLTKLAALEFETVSSIGPALPAKVGAMGVAVDAHFRNSTAHPTGGGFAPDSVNVYVESPPYDINEAVSKLNKIRAAYTKHALNSTTSSIHWHNSSDDTKNVPVVPVATTVAGATVLYADMWRCYEGHRVQTAAPAVHPASDATNTLGSIDMLSDLIKAVITFLVDETPTVPAGESEALTQAEALYGFEV